MNEDVCPVKLERRVRARTKRINPYHEWQWERLGKDKSGADLRKAQCRLCGLSLEVERFCSRCGVKLPKEEPEALCVDCIGMTRRDDDGGDQVIKTSLLYWWPKVRDLGIPVPRTEIWETDLKSWFDAMESGRLPPNVGFIKEAQRVARLIGYPLFLRTDLASGKHHWKRTCNVQEESALPHHIYGVLEENEIAGIVGLEYRALVFREMLSLFAAFTAFRGDLPIARERRYFVRDGQIECHHPYWPEHAIRNPSCKEWRRRLASLNYETIAEKEILAHYSERVANEIAGYWSVDYAFTIDGTWYLIDMAEGEKSWHPECERE